ncbi:ABC transporter transmembrane domain-containing protein [Roseovarius sp. MS2]|uniref:ABC transporter transmembrane domain-containing protein n=1 Tax=Roseovarius sp. MS2 TaxID=3390728 RepID=UPI003EDC90AC
MALPPLLDRGRGRGLALVAMLTLMQGVAAGAAAFATRALFETMHGGDALPLVGLSVLAGAGTMIAMTRIAARYLGEGIGQDYARQIRAALFEHAAHMPASAVAERRAGYVSLRFVGDMTAFRNWLGLGLPRLVAGAVLIPTMLVVLWLLDPVFALIVVPVFGITLLAITLGGMRLIPLHRRLRVRRARIAAEMAERMPLAPQLDRLGRRRKELAQLDKRTEAMIRAALRHRLSAETLNALPDLAAGIAAALVILTGHRAGLGTGNIAAALAVLGLLLSPLRDLGGVWNHRAAFRVAATKAQAALSRQKRDLYRTGQRLPKGPVDVTFENVPLPSGQMLSLHAKGGTKTCLPVGELDARAVRDMLLGLDTPWAGRILLSGIDLRDLSRGSLRRHVQCLSAAPEVLQGSLRRALLMGCDHRPEDATLEQLARDVGLGPLLKRLGGLSGTVLEGGKNLTQTERFALGLARIRLLPPKVLLLGLESDPGDWMRFPVHLGKTGVTVIQMGRAQQAAQVAA